MNYLKNDSLGIYRSFEHDNNHNKGPSPFLMGANTLIGNNVYNSKSENLGDIKEIMLDMRTGRVSYAVLEFGGFLGMGSKLFAVPWSVLKLDTVEKRFIFDVSKESLENAPGFEKDDWPNMADPAWEKGIHDYYGAPLYRQP